MSHTANPVCTDVRHLFGTDAVFSLGDRFIRPAQDCSVGYGCAPAFHEITHLAPYAHRKRRMSGLLRDCAPGSKGAHIFGRA